MPCGFAELLAIRLLATFRSGFDPTTRLEGFVDAVPVRSSDMVGIGGYIRLLLRGAIWLGEGEGSFAPSTLEDNSKPLGDTFCDMFSRR
jgi:hypothetical protein